MLDEAGRTLGVEAPDDRQVVCDEFRRARGLHTERVTLDWMRRNDLDVDSYAELAAAEARLSILCEASRTYTLGLIETIEPVCWLHDAIRLSGLYPRLKRRLAAPASSDGRARRAAAPDFERALREHCARLGEPAPANVEEYARALDFAEGGAELAAALARRSRSASSSCPSGAPEASCVTGHPPQSRQRLR